MKRRVNLKVIAIIFFLISVNLSIQSVGAINYWSTEMQLTYDTHADRLSSIFRANDRKIWVVWYSDRVNGDTEIFYKVYNPNQTNPWSPDTRLTFSSGLDVAPTIMQALDGRIWVAWVSKRSGSYEVYYKTYNGATWSSDTKIPILAEPEAQYPSILQATNGTILIFWGSPRGGSGNQIYFKSSYDNGVSWTDDKLFTSAASSDDNSDPAAALTSDGHIWLVWAREGGSPPSQTDNIYYTFHDGTSWRTAAAVPDVSSNLNLHPSITQAADGKMWVVWDAGPGPDSVPADVYCNVWDGTRWSTSGPTRIVTHASECDENMPAITKAWNGDLWVAWCSNRTDTNFDLYYKTNSPLPPSQHDIGIFSVSPQKSIVSQGRSVSVDIVAQNLGTSTETFNITLFANTTKVGSKEEISLAPGLLYPTIINWNTAGFPLGKYTLTANATLVADDANPQDNTYVDGNVTVVIHDVAVLKVTPSFTLWYKGYTNGYIYVQVKNNGTIGENVSVSLYRNTTYITTYTLYDLGPGENGTLSFWFATASVPYGNYRIIAKAQSIPDEINYTNNNLEDGMVKVTIPGDVNGDKKVDVYDLALISAHWSDPPEGPLGYLASIDIDRSDSVDIDDVQITSLYWALSW